LVAAEGEGVVVGGQCRALRNSEPKQVGVLRSSVCMCCLRWGVEHIALNKCGTKRRRNSRWMIKYGRLCLPSAPSYPLQSIRKKWSQNQL
jgi:hypothetical protein